MPAGDRTGPEGYGARTGRAMGYCSGYDSPGYTRSVPRGEGGFGRGGGFGGGYGRRFLHNASPEYYDDQYYGREPAYPRYEPKPEEEASYLNRIAESMEKELSEIKDRISKLAKKEE